MEQYIKSVYILAKTISYLFIFFIIMLFFKGEIKETLIFIVIMFTYWGIYFQLKKKKGYFFWITFIPISVVWLLLLIQEIRRVLFIIENHGMDSPYIPGSPLAFLIGFIFELFFFIPMTNVFLKGISYLKNKKK